jgi:Na+-translocating ferredoxin:NAD+ oxidoreductase RnfC subunit
METNRPLDRAPHAGISVPQLIQAQLDEAGTADARGRRLSLAGRRAATVVGRVCDDEPLLHTELTLARLAPERVLRGLAAAALLCHADSALLAVDDQAADVVQLLDRAARGSRVRLVPLPARYPMDPAALLCDLAERGDRVAPDTVLLGAVELCDIAAALEGRPALRRTVTIAGCVREPAVVQAPLGARLEDLAAACGGCPDPAPVCYHNGLLGGRRVLTSHSVELDTRGIVLVPHDHVAVQRETTPLADELARIASACVNCRICTDVCTVHLCGGHLEPHVLMRALASFISASDPDASSLGALECSGCQVCTTCCPASLSPSRAVAAVSSALRARGVLLAERFPLRPRPDRAGRRQGRGRLTERLGLASCARDRLPGVRQVLPDRLVVALRSPLGTPRVSAVCPGERVSAGDVIALAPAECGEPDVRAAVAGIVDAVDVEDGVSIVIR